jgi:peroxiredoxin
MNIRILLACSLLTAPFVSSLLAAEPAAPSAAAPAPAPTPATAASSTASDAPAPAADPASAKVEEQLGALVQRVKTKLSAGAETEAALADELKAFDALLAEHRGEKTNAVAAIALSKAALYIEVFENYDQGLALLRQIKTDFPDTQVAKNADGIIAQVEQQKEAHARRAALKVGTVFPDFSEKDIAGQPISVSKYKGKVVLVDFWATWCGPCMAELPNVLAAYEKYHDKGFEIVGVSLDEKLEELKTTLAEKKMTWQQYFDGKGWDSEVPKKYGIIEIPATFLLDRDGRIVAQDLHGTDLDQQLQKLLAK